MALSRKYFYQAPGFIERIQLAVDNKNVGAKKDYSNWKLRNDRLR